MGRDRRPLPSDKMIIKEQMILELQDFGKEDGLRGEIKMAELPTNEIVDDRHITYVWHRKMLYKPGAELESVHSSPKSK